MKRVFMIHGWDGFPENHWFPWVKAKLEDVGFMVIVPAMPNSSEPRIKEWVSHLKKVVGELDQQTYFVGHSIGCQAILRYVEQEKFKGKIPGMVFVAGWFKLDHLENNEVKTIAKPWLENPIAFNKIKQKTSKLTVFLSSNDPYGNLAHNTKTFREKLDAIVIIEEKKGHFTEEDGITEFPEVVDLLEITPNK